MVFSTPKITQNLKRCTRKMEFRELKAISERHMATLQSNAQDRGWPLGADMAHQSPWGITSTVLSSCILYPQG